MSDFVPTPSVDDTSSGSLVLLPVDREQPAEAADVADDLAAGTSTARAP